MTSPDAPRPLTPIRPKADPARLDLPLRVVVDEYGSYWREYDDHYSMCPVSDDNEPVVPVAVYTLDAARSASPDPDPVWTPPAFTVERLAEILHDLDGTQHYITHETSYDGDDMEQSDCIGGVESHMDDARELLVSLQGEMEPRDD